jgi:hypothetical protein
MTALPRTAVDEKRLLYIMWIAFLLAVGLYAPVPYLLIREGADDAAALPVAARSGLYFAALGAAVSSLAAKRWWTNSLLAVVRSEVPTPVKADVWMRLRAGCVVTWALSEAVALLGFALAMIARRPADGVPFAAGAALLLYLQRPATWPVAALESAAVA